MSTEPRDTQFAGFAKLLWQDLLQANSYGYIDVNEYDDPTDTPNYLEVIARRAYDFAKHVIDSCEDQEYAMMSDYHHVSASMLEGIPDMIEWPSGE